MWHGSGHGPCGGDVGSCQLQTWVNVDHGTWPQVSRPVPPPRPRAHRATGLGRGCLRPVREPHLILRHVWTQLTVRWLLRVQGPLAPPGRGWDRAGHGQAPAKGVLLAALPPRHGHTQLGARGTEEVPGTRLPSRPVTLGRCLSFPRLRFPV